MLGAAWYVLSVDRYTSCWKSVCRKEKSPVKCLLGYLDCDTPESSDLSTWASNTSVFTSCDPNGDTTFKFGIFAKAVEKNVVSSSFFEKYFYCLWWGLQNLRYAVSSVFKITTSILLPIEIVYRNVLMKTSSFLWFLKFSFRFYD